MNSVEMYNKLKPYLATTMNYSNAAKRMSMTATRVIEFAPEENRPVKCYIPVRWVPPHVELWKNWCRLNYAQFCEAYKLVQEPL